ncbi:hypothetical protein HPB50_005600 [Hyalomma asiaticum]|uniref:Uncharacterized protein n=1 Tax=Hyalomma asiaticum TaxID=266040 RepID=A0ACB7RJ87_HYAAI|nr:hypothetical protein HPB50_005600 [Hyalomma asiaticum]
MSEYEQGDTVSLEKILVHLEKAVKAEQGVTLTRLQGILSRLPRPLLGQFTASPDTIRSVAKSFPNRLVVSPDDRVYTSDEVRRTGTVKGHNPPEKQQHLGEGSAPYELLNVTGTVSKLLVLYGFVDLAHPHRVSVFFDKRVFDGNRHNDLTKSWLKVGDHVVLDAVRSPSGHRAKYQATRIEPVKKMAQNPGSSQMPCKTDDSGIIYGCTGTIQTVNPTQGFILFGANNRDCASFFVSGVEKSLLEPEKSLDEVFKCGSEVLFDARPRPKPISFSKWLATNVRKVHERECLQSSRRSSDSGDEDFLLDHEIAALLIDPREFSTRRKLSSVRGAFYPTSKDVGVVSTFDQEAMVRVAVSVAYCDGVKLTSFDELLKDCAVQDEVKVFIDAVEADHDAWVATLMWTGERPPHPFVDQSEAAFHDALTVVLEKMPWTDLHPAARDVGSLNVPVSFCSISDVDHAITSYPNSKGILKVVNEDNAVCEVQEPEGCRDVEFVRFYRDGIPHMGQFRRILGEGDVVQIDYMVGTIHGKDEVCCRLVWQGDRPLCERLTSSFEFGVLLKAKASSNNLNTPAGPHAGGTGQARPGRVPNSMQATDIEKPGASCSPQASGRSERSYVADVVSQVLGRRGQGSGPSKSTGIAAGSAAASDKATVAHPTWEPKVYVFQSRKGTVIQVFGSAALVKVREGQEVRGLTISADCFYFDGRPFLGSLSLVLHKGDIVNVDYMVGRTGSGDIVRCDLAWQGRKPQGVPCLTEDEFRQQIIGHGSGNTFIDDLQSTTPELNDLSKDAPRSLAKQSVPQAGTHPQTELHWPSTRSQLRTDRPQAEVYHAPTQSSQAAPTQPHTGVHWQAQQAMPPTSAGARWLPPQSPPQTANTRSQVEVCQPAPQLLSQPMDTLQVQQHQRLPQAMPQANTRPQMQANQPALQLGINISPQAEACRPKTEVYCQAPQGAPTEVSWSAQKLLLQAVDARTRAEACWQLTQSPIQTADTRQQVEVQKPPQRSPEPVSTEPSHLSEPSPSQAKTKERWLVFSEKTYNQAMEMVRERCGALVYAEVQEVIQDMMNLEEIMLTDNPPMLQGRGGSTAVVAPTARKLPPVAHSNVPQLTDNTSMLQARSDRKPPLEPTVRQPTSLPCPNLSQKLMENGETTTSVPRANVLQQLNIATSPSWGTTDTMGYTSGEGWGTATAWIQREPGFH